MGFTRGTVGRVVALTVGVAAAGTLTAAVSASAFARTIGVPSAQAPARTAHAQARGGAATARAAHATGSAVPACQARVLSLGLAGTDAGVGTTALTVSITNGSAAACALHGYPAVSLIRPGGSAAAPAAVSHGSGAIFAGLTAGTIRLAPRGQASFFLTYRDFSPVTGRAGPPVTGLQVSLPGVSGQFTVASRFAPYGSVSVSPIRAGARKE